MRTANEVEPQGRATCIHFRPPAPGLGHGRPQTEKCPMGRGERARFRGEEERDRTGCARLVVVVLEARTEKASSLASHPLMHRCLLRPTDGQTEKHQEGEVPLAGTYLPPLLIGQSRQAGWLWLRTVSSLYVCLKGTVRTFGNERADVGWGPRAVVG